MSRHSNFVRRASSAVVLVMVLVVALCCTSAMSSLPSTGLTRAEDGPLLKGSPVLASVEASLAHTPTESPQMESAGALGAEQAHKDTERVPAVVSDVDGAAAVSTGQAHTLPALISTQVRHSPLANGEASHPSEGLNEASASLSRRQRNQLVMPVQGATPIFLAQQNAQESVTTEGPSKAVAATEKSLNEKVKDAVDYGAIISGGVVISTITSLLFACLLLFVVLMEIGTVVELFMKHRRARAAEKCVARFP